MNWTETDRQELSRKVAEKFRPADYIFANKADGFTGDIWLHNDWHTLCEECNKRGIWVRRCQDMFIAYSSGEVEYILASVRMADHNNDPSLAERIARMMALKEINLEATK